MKKLRTATFAAAMVASLLLVAHSHAQAQTEKKEKKEKKEAGAAKPAVVGSKPGVPAKPAAKKKPEDGSSRTSLKSDAKNMAVGIQAAEAALTPAEMVIAERVQVGVLPCELGASVTLTADSRMPGYFDMQGKNFKYRMFPVTTSTGAIRLEDQKAGAVWLQLANKSMLMNQKLGIRLADECMSPTQMAVAENLKLNPPVSILEALKPVVVMPTTDAVASPSTSNK